MTLQGEGPAAGRTAWFIRTGGCNLSCSWCVVPESMVLRPDFTWTPAGDLQVGDVVLGRTPPDHGKHGRLVESTVTATTRRDSPLMRVNGNLTVAADTRFWTSQNRRVHSGWRNIERCEGLSCTFLADPVKRNQTNYQWGYLAGMSDGDGCFWTLKGRNGNNYRRWRLALRDQSLLDRTREYAAACGYTLRPGTHTYTGTGDGGDMPCLWLTDSVSAYFFEQQLAQDHDSESWRWGYLAGVFDAEGHLNANGTIRIAQYSTVNGPTYDRIATTADRLGFDVVREPKGIRLRGGGSGGELWRFLTGATPGKTSSVNRGIGRAPNNARTIHTVNDAGHGEVVSLTTSSGNYIAEGWLVHNCDSAYTWDSARFNLREEIRHTPVATLVDSIPTGALVILTGGEPLLQQDRPGWYRLLTELRGKRCELHVETNGTIAPNPITRDMVNLFMVSPKLANAGQHRGHQNPALHSGWREPASDGQAHLKIVCSDTSDVDTAVTLANTHHWPLNRVWVMPEGTTTTVLNERWPAIAQAAANHGINATHRLHVLAWGEKRGH